MIKAKIAIITEAEWMKRDNIKWGTGLIVLSYYDRDYNYQYIGKDLTSTNSITETAFGKVEKIVR